MNRITNAVARMETQIAGKNLPAETLAKSHKSLDMDLEEYCKFQEMKSVAFLESKLTLDEAQSVYAMLGNTPEQFNSQSLAVKAVLTKLFSELLGAYISRRQTVAA